MLSLSSSVQVRIEELRGRSADYFPCGVLKSSPKDLSLPATTINGWTEAIVFCDTLFNCGTEVTHTYYRYLIVIVSDSIRLSPAYNYKVTRKAITLHMHRHVHIIRQGLIK